MTQDEMRELRDYLDGKFEVVDKRFDGVDARLDGMDKRFDGVDQRFDRVETTMEQEFGAITTQFSEVRECLDRASARTCGRIDKHFDALRADLRLTRPPK